MSDPESPPPFLYPYIDAAIAYVMLMYIFRIVQVLYQPDNKKKQNKLTLLPLIIVFVYLVVLFASNEVAYEESVVDVENLSNVKTIAVSTLIELIFWSTIEFAICFEWEVITSLVKFQSTCSLAEMGIKKYYFNDKHEGFIVK